MRLGTIAFLAGIWALHGLAELPDLRWALILPLLVPLFWRLPRLRCVIWGVSGFFWALLWVGPVHQLPAVFESVDLQAEGWITEIPSNFARSTRFELAVISLRYGDMPVPFSGTLRLYWYDTNPSLRVGDRWAFTVRLKRPHGLANPGGFDYQRWLFVNNVGATGYVRADHKPRLLAQGERYPVDRFRQMLAERMRQNISNSPYAGMLIALAVGERQGIAEGQWAVLSATGTSHLLAISGLHVGLVSGLIFFLFRGFWAGLPRLACWFPAPKAAALGALLGAGIYSLLAGFSLPTQRALLMIGIVTLALLWQRPIVPSRLLALVLLLVLLWDPGAPLAGGFWLSFGAVAVILYVLVGRRGDERPLREWLGLQLAIGLALMPALLILFQTVSLVGPVANLIAIPWVGVTVVPLTLLAILAGFVSDALQAGLLTLAALATDWLWVFLTTLASLPGATIKLPAPPTWTLLFGVPGICLLLAPAGLSGRWLGGVLCLPLFLFPQAAPAPGGFWLVLLDVGQGLAVVVRTRHHVLVYDTGPRLGTQRDTGGMVLVPFLREQGLSRIDTLLISHNDGQHTSGVRSLLENLAVGQVLTSSLSEVPVAGAMPCRAGKSWTWDGVKFDLLHPPAGDGFSGNNGSCVLRVEGQGGRVLLPGDIEAPAANALLKRYDDELVAEVLVAPHHGSRNLGLAGFIEAIRPHYVLFSTGYRNRFAYPRAETIAYYRSRGAKLLNTAQAGAITFRMEDNDNELTPESFRKQFRRYWHAPTGD